MVKITFVEPDGKEKLIEAQTGMTLMETARNAGIRGIDAECGGACSCSTCHVYVCGDWFKRLPAASDMEYDMLDFAFLPEPNSSRLSCQIAVTDDLNGLRVHLPSRQS
ncbi:2Fe-2S iron-sulfur cluster-binding protein [Leisingera thetidis]|uniref:2Fe-2S iron-sulfur cluster-binding protein n=1 Tax=Leisingera thetidis TaxID=2930199 RepID=UPI0021F7052D|nr:2Fe-2S iron-sulfur cluster-binding protein [Leisingera thetidis]